MILGVGIDLISNHRVQQELAEGPWLAGDGIFTASEISRCNQGRRPALCYAACFAAKEAMLKALGVRIPDLTVMSEVEIEPDRKGSAAVMLHGRMKAECQRLRVKQVRVSIASSKGQTGAMVILES